MCTESTTDKIKDKVGGLFGKKGGDQSEGYGNDNTSGGYGSNQSGNQGGNY